MEYDSDEVPYDTYDESRSAPHEKEEKGSQDSKTLFDPRWMAKLATVDGIISDSDCTSASLRNLDLHYDDFRSPEIYKIRSSRTLVGPIKALIMQLIVLITMIVFVGWTSGGHRIVPNSMATVYLRHPQSTITAITLFGSLLSLVNVKLFSEAIRFSTIVWLGHRSSRRMSLYSLYAITSISSRNILSCSDRWYVHWTIISVIYFCLFAAQTSAWTTILAPRLMLISELGSFQDLDFSTPFDASVAYESSWGQMSDSGVAATMEVLNATQYLTCFGSTFRGTTRGILPIRNIFENGAWISAEAVQQGLSVNVSCEDTPDSDHLVVWNQTMLNPIDALTSVSLCCNCTSESSWATNFVRDNSTEYLNLAVCPPGLPQWMNNTDSIITVYVQNNMLLGNLTCTLKPQLLNVNVTYNRDGFATLVPMTRQLPEIPTFIMSKMVDAAAVLQQHFVRAQSISGNNIMDSINLLTAENTPHWTADPRVLLGDILAHYIRGVFEYYVTAFRYTTLYEVGIGTHYYSLTKNSPAVVWGQVPELRLIIIISPLAIMITTISIFLFSLRKAQNLTLDHIASFDPMNPLHVIAACGSGNVQTVAFPGYSKHITSFSKDLEVQLPECHARNESAGFQFFRRRH